MKSKISLIAISVVAVLLSLDCSHPTQTTGNGSGIGNAVVGILYQPDGKTPAAGVRVHIRPKTSLADTSGAGLTKRMAILTATDSVVTDSAGKYAFDTTIDTGTYVITSASGNNAVLIDSVAVKNKAVTDTLAPDTLKPAGALKGVIRLSEGGDPRKVFVLAFGIDRFARVNADGSFKFASLAEAKYDLRLISSLDNYGVLDTVGVPVRSADTMNLDTISLPFTGIPTPRGLTISYDTLKQIVTLTWKKADTALVKSYNVYRRNVDSNTVAVRINTSPVVDTVYKDSTGVQGTTYEYMVAAVNKSTTEGTKSAAVSVKIVNGFILKRFIGTSGNGIGQYSSPYGIALSSNGYVFIADFDSGRVMLFDTNGNFQQSYTGFSAPENVVPAQNGDFYVVEKNTQLIKLVDSLGQILSQFGGNGTQNGKFTDISPCFFIIANSKLYIPDYGNNRIQIFDSMGTYLKTLAIAAPWSISMISESKLAIGSDSKLSILDTNGVLVSEWSGVYAFTSTTTKKGNLAIVTNEQEGSVSVVKIAFYSPQGNRLGIFGVSNQSQNSDYFFQEITGIAVDLNNNLYIVDSGRKLVKVFALPSEL